MQGRGSVTMFSMSAFKTRIVLRIAAVLPVVALILAHTNSGPIFKG